MIIDRPEVESGAEARKVTCIGRRVGAFALKKGKAEDEGIAREGCVHVEVAKKDLFWLGPWFFSEKARLTSTSCFDYGVGS